MKNYDKLINLLVYPRPQKTEPPVRENFENNSLWGQALDEYAKYVEEENNEYKRKIQTYNENVLEIHNEFWDELYHNLGWNLLPKNVASALQSIVWNMGHSSGYYEVYNYAQEMSMLVDAILNPKTS